MERRRGCLLAALIVPVHVVDAVRTVVDADRRLAAFVIDREDHRVVHDRAAVGRELHDDASTDLVVEHVAVALAHALALALSCEIHASTKAGTLPSHGDGLDVSTGTCRTPFQAVD
jgi:signal transduction histidine kinase